MTNLEQSINDANAQSNVLNLKSRQRKSRQKRIIRTINIEYLDSSVQIKNEITLHSRFFNTITDETLEIEFSDIPHGSIFFYSFELDPLGENYTGLYIKISKKKAMMIATETDLFGETEFDEDEIGEYGSMYKFTSGTLVQARNVEISIF